jgi:hypothetical protein
MLTQKMDVDTGSIALKNHINILKTPCQQSLQQQIQKLPKTAKTLLIV